MSPLEPALSVKRRIWIPCNCIIEGHESDVFTVMILLSHHACIMWLMCSKTRSLFIGELFSFSMFEHRLELRELCVNKQTSESDHMTQPPVLRRYTNPDFRATLHCHNSPTAYNQHKLLVWTGRYTTQVVHVRDNCDTQNPIIAHIILHWPRSWRGWVIGCGVSCVNSKISQSPPAEVEKSLVFFEDCRRTEITFRNDFIELGTDHDGCIAVLPETLIGLEIRKVVPWGFVVIRERWWRLWPLGAGIEKSSDAVVYGVQLEVVVPAIGPVTTLVATDSVVIILFGVVQVPLIVLVSSDSPLVLLNWNVL
jgi:hypothetical protein